MSDSPFRVIPGGVPDKPKRNRKARTLTSWECRTCDAHEGVRTRALTKVRYNPFTDGQLRVTGGTDVWVCAFCLMKGRYTPVTA